MENNQFAIEALYSPQRVPHYQGNPLIEALPPAESEESMMRSLLHVPDFHQDQCNWLNAERIPMVMQLSNFMLPMDRHLQLGQSIDMVIRQGYVGREPNTPAYYAAFAKLYAQQKQGGCFEPSLGLLTPQLSGSLIGVSGAGKTTTLRRILSRFPKVIYHPQLNHYQVPYLMVEAPYNGAGVKELAESIFRKMDLLLPDSEFGKTYSNTKSGAGTLMNHAARIIKMHSVGLLVIDEIQNLENSSKNREALMTLLVSASNELGVPILFVGTNKAKKILTLDFRQGRRSIGLGSTYWEALVRGGPDADSEWEDFLDVLFRFQWVKKPLALTQGVADLMFHYTQGIVDWSVPVPKDTNLRWIIPTRSSVHESNQTYISRILQA